MSNRSASESTPLLDNEAAEPNPTATSGLANRARAFRIATTTALVSGILTLIFIAVCVVLLSGAPSEYYPQYHIYYSFSSVGGFAAISCLHSGLVLLDGAPLRGTVTGILVDVFAGVYFLFESLYSMQLSLQGGWQGYHPCRTYGTPPDRLDACEKWYARVVPVVWTYLFVTLVLGLSHVVLLLLRAATFKRGGRVLRVQLVGEDGTPIRPAATS